MFVPAGSPVFFLREHRFAVRCRVVTLTLLFMLSTCLLDIFLYIFFINIGCATLYHLSMMYVTVYNMSFNSNCRILAAELNYRFTEYFLDSLSLFSLNSNSIGTCKGRKLFKLATLVYSEKLPILSVHLWKRFRVGELTPLKKDIAKISLKIRWCPIILHCPIIQYLPFCFTLIAYWPEKKKF